MGLFLYPRDALGLDHEEIAIYRHSHLSGVVWEPTATSARHIYSKMPKALSKYRLFPRSTKHCLLGGKQARTAGPLMDLQLFDMDVNC